MILLLLLSRPLLNLASFFTRFANLHMYVLRLRPLFIQSDETSSPDGHWIIMSFIFKSTALSSQWPTSSSTSLSFSQPTHPLHEDSHTLFICTFTNMLKPLSCPHPDDHIFLWSNSQVFVQAAETIYVLQAIPICSPTSLWAAPIMGPVCDRDGWEPKGAHKTCSREGGMEVTKRVDSRGLRSL